MFLDLDTTANAQKSTFGCLSWNKMSYMNTCKYHSPMGAADTHYLKKLHLIMDFAIQL